MRAQRTVTKTDLVEETWKRLGAGTKREAAAFVDVVFDVIKETLERGEDVRVPGFGNFILRDKRARTGTNPQTGVRMTIHARRVLRFKPSQYLKNSLNL